MAELNSAVIYDMCNTLDGLCISCTWPYSDHGGRRLDSSKGALSFCHRVTRRGDLVMYLWSCACTWPYSDSGGCMLSVLKRTFTLVSAARVRKRGDLARTNDMKGEKI